jgi:hypothetical protein
MRNQDGKLAEWDFPRDHFETNISYFFELQPEEIPEVKYPQYYQFMFGGTPGTVNVALHATRYTVGHPSFSE